MNKYIDVWELETIVFIFEYYAMTGTNNITIYLFIIIVSGLVGVSLFGVRGLLLIFRDHLEKLIGIFKENVGAILHHNHSRRRTIG